MAGPIVVGTDPDRCNRAAVTWAAAEAERRRLPLRLLCAREYSPARQPPVSSPSLPHRGPQVGCWSWAHDVRTLRGLAGTAGTALPVIAQAACPVVVVRDSVPDRRRSPHIVAAVNAGWGVRLFWAFWTNTRRCGECRRLLSETVARRQASHPKVALQQAVVRGRPFQVLARESSNALELVVGTRGHDSSTGRVVDRVVHRVLLGAVCPVVVVSRPGGRRLPHERPRVSRLSQLTRRAEAHSGERCVRGRRRRTRWRRGRRRPADRGSITTGPSPSAPPLTSDVYSGGPTHGDSVVTWLADPARRSRLVPIRSPRTRRRARRMPSAGPSICDFVKSGRQDLNLRPLDPQSSALPSCATSRCVPWCPRGEPREKTQVNLTAPGAAGRNRREGQPARPADFSHSSATSEESSLSLTSFFIISSRSSVVSLAEMAFSADLALSSTADL